MPVGFVLHLKVKIQIFIFRTLSIEQYEVYCEEINVFRPEFLAIFEQYIYKKKKNICIIFKSRDDFKNNFVKLEY